MLQRMPLRLLEIIAPIQGIEPRVQQILGPLAVADHHAVLAQPFVVLRQDKVDVGALQVAEGLDHTVGRDHAAVDQHDGFEARGGHDVVLDGE